MLFLKFLYHFQIKLALPTSSPVTTATAFKRNGFVTVKTIAATEVMNGNVRKTSVTKKMILLAEMVIASPRNGAAMAIPIVPMPPTKW